MDFGNIRKIITAVGVFAAGWLALRWCLPVVLPFLIGSTVALAAEPAVKLCAEKGKLPRSVAAGIGVSVTLLLLVGVVSLAGMLTVKELGVIAKALPDMGQTAQRGILLLEDSLISAADRLPDGIRSLATGTVLELFDGGSALVGQLSRKVPDMLTSVLGWIPDGALGLGTGVIAGFMISVRLPQLRQYLQNGLPEIWYDRYLPAVRRVRQALGGWLKAQLKLALLTCGVLAAGFLLLRIPYGVLWAVPVALVDAIPMLGTGVVLIPWALVVFLQGKTVMGIGLLLLCAVTMILRRILEPKLVGKQLGLDPLLTLVFLYAGYRLWGFLGMILAPLLAAAVKTFTVSGGERGTE